MQVGRANRLYSHCTCDLNIHDDSFKVKGFNKIHFYKNSRTPIGMAATHANLSIYHTFNTPSNISIQL